MNYHCDWPAEVLPLRSWASAQNVPPCSASYQWGMASLCSLLCSDPPTMEILLQLNESRGFVIEVLSGEFVLCSETVCDFLEVIARY